MKFKFKITKEMKIIGIVGISFLSIGFISYKLYFEKMSIFTNNEKKFKKATESYYKIRPYELPKNGGYKDVSLQQIYDRGLMDALLVPKKNKFCNEKESYVRVVNNNGEYKYNVYLACGRYKSRVDHKAPEIILNGGSKIIVNLNDKFTDPGIKTVIDNKDKVIDNSRVIVKSNVNTSKVGNYKITYKVYDSSFNVSKVTRTVVVAETLNQIVAKNTGVNRFYKGNVKNNYLYFSGMLFRIVKENSDGTIKIVSEDNIAHLSYTEDNFKNSNIKEWLNNYYLDHISENSKKYIVKKSTWCIDTISDINNFTCNNITTATVGLLNVCEYLNSVDSTTYLDGYTKPTLLINKKDKNNMYVSGIYPGTPEIYDSSIIYPSIRPSFNIVKDTFAISGDGSISNPYMLGDFERGKENDLLNKRLIGEFVKYSGYTARIANITEKGNTELVFMDELDIKKTNGAVEKITFSPSKIKNYKFNINQKNNLGKLLNEEYINYVNSSKMVSDSFEIPTTSTDGKYNSFKTEKVTGKIFIPYTYMMFSSDYANNTKNKFIYIYCDYSKSDNKIFLTNANNQLTFEMLNDVYNDYTFKPVVFISSKVKISSGKGTYNNPYIIK